MSSFKDIGGRYGQHSGSAKYKNLEVENNFYQGGVLYPPVTATTQKGAKVYYVDNTNGSSSNNGLSKDSPMKYVQDAITKVNANDSGKGSIIFVAPGLYAEATPVSITASDVKIIGTGLPEDTVIFGVTTQGTVAASDDHLFSITGGNIGFYNLALFTYLNTKAAIYADGESGGYAGGFCEVRNCIFSPQAVDGQKYGIYLAGAPGWIIENNQFLGTATAGIYIDDSSGNTHYCTRTVIRGNHFIGCGDAGIKVDQVVHELIIDRNIFQAGSESGYNQTDDIVLTANMTAGSIHVTDNYASTTTFTDFVADSKVGGTVRIFDNHYTQDT